MQNLSVPKDYTEDGPGESRFQHPDTMHIVAVHGSENGINDIHGMGPAALPK